MSELSKKVKKSVQRLKTFCPPEGYYLAFSGGKDSVVCKALLEMSGCRYDSTYRVTSVDPPELVRFIKEKHPDVKREIPRYEETYKNKKLAGKPITMWNLIPEKVMPPTRIARYCCKYLKESGGDGRMTVTGVRWAESVNRTKSQGQVVIQSHGKVQDDSGAFKQDERRGSLILTNDNENSRRLVEQCYKRHKTTVNPIIDWSDSDVWEFISTENIPHCDLYHEGFTRLGCIGCPMARKQGRERQFYRWKVYKSNYLLAFNRMLRERERRGLKNLKLGTTAMDVFNWWMEYDVLPGQVDLFESSDDDD